MRPLIMLFFLITASTSQAQIVLDQSDNENRSKFFVTAQGSYELIMNGSEHSTKSLANIPIVTNRLGAGVGVNYIITESISIGINTLYNTGTKATLYSKKTDDTRNLDGSNGVVNIGLNFDYLLQPDYKGVSVGAMAEYGHPLSEAMQSSIVFGGQFGYWFSLGKKTRLGIKMGLGYGIMEEKSGTFEGIDHLTDEPGTFNFDTGNPSGFQYKSQFVFGFLF